MMPPASRSRSGSLVSRQPAGDVDQAEQTEQDRRPTDDLAATRAVAVGCRRVRQAISANRIGAT